MHRDTSMQTANTLQSNFPLTKQWRKRTKRLLINCSKHILLAFRHTQLTIVSICSKQTRILQNRLPHLVVMTHSIARGRFWYYPKTLSLKFTTFKNQGFKFSIKCHMLQMLHSIFIINNHLLI